ncbi:protein DpdH [Halotia branconii]|uniref:Protein DpdH n=1 Tax=Halotia branconii CENA392 TaxID=1539056 RepID=A0AAJ6NQB4_9CYAN|nr:protein DpdH [Halotia branconii]WGV24608.1 protein DpdH [Halotia branconii CENA392]
MTFEKFICWKLDMIRQVMNVEATQTANHLFLATHHPIAMYRQDSIKALSKSEYNESQFLHDFLAEKDFAFVPVLGESGTGKSHLIRWLQANIKSTDKRKVLLIPRIGTNLKDIIEKILNIAEFEVDKLDEYRKRLNQSSRTFTDKGAREQLLNNLAFQVGVNGQHKRAKLADGETQEYLIEKLPALLYDDFFREHLLRDGKIIHRLVIHTLGYQYTIEDINERREFSLEDLPLNISDFQKAGEKAREFYALLINDEDIQKETVTWLNDHLDEAITQVLNFGREDLQQLMREVRETLAEKNIELVLLIEDFAKLQGIDREVLEAVLAKPQQGENKPLCAMRTALACTTGYFKNLIDTVQQRVTFSVNLNIDTIGEQSLITQNDIQVFVARYLNAVRLEEREIENWANSQSRDELPSACSECEHSQACHTGFGHVQGMGLYPFNSKALVQMFSRVNPGEFNPRILIRDVLKHTLENSIDDIKNGTFPSVTLGNYFGNMRLSTDIKLAIQAKDPQNSKRREVFLDLWDDSNELCNLSPEVHTAFNLSLLDVKTKPKEIPPIIPENRPVPPKVVEPSGDYQIDTSLQDKLKILDNWNNQQILPDAIAKDIRELLFPAIIEKIEWDTEMLLKGSFVGSGGKLLQQRNLIFHNPKVKRGTYSGVVLSLPLNPDDDKEFTETAYVFQGILKYDKYQNWKFENGDRYFRMYAKYLERWSQYVVEKIRLYPRESGEAWNPVPAAVELLAISATMAGYPTNTLENLINSLFIDLDKNDDTTRASTWKKLFDTFSLKRNREALLDIVKSRIACTKGSNSTFQILDAIQIIEPLEKVRKSWQPQQQIPEDVRDKFPELQKVRQQVDELLEKAIQEEYERQLDIYQRLISEFGEDVKKKDVIDVLKSAMEAAQDAAVFRGKKGFEGMTTVLEQFRRTAINPYRDTMKRVQAEKENPESNIGKLLQYLSEDYQKVITDSLEFLDNTNNFLDASILEANSQIAELEKSGGATVESSYQEICQGLANLRNLMNEIKGETKCS